jgi:hypothetical protein
LIDEFANQDDLVESKDVQLEVIYLDQESKDIEKEENKGMGESQETLEYDTMEGDTSRESLLHVKT